MRFLFIAAVIAFALPALAVDETPEMSTVEGKHIILKVRAEDLKVLDDPQAWVDKLDLAYEAYADLVGATPFNGKKITILSVDELPGAWARAGDPIVWRREFIAKTFRDGINKGDWSFGIIHEISHTFDLDYRWAWDLELIANFKMDYVFPKIKAVVFSGGKVCDYGDPNGLRMTDIYRQSEESRMQSDLMLEGGWGDDPYHRKLTEVVDEIGWEPFKCAFRWFNTLTPDEIRWDDFTKRSLFIRLLDDNSDVNVSERFINWGFACLTVDVKDTKEAARILHARNWNAQIAKRPIEVAAGEKVTIRVNVVELKPEVIAKGLATHAVSEIVFDLGGKYNRFESGIGVPGEASLGERGSVGFEVVTDGKKIYEGPVLKGGGVYKKVSSDITGAKELKLIVNNGGDGQSCDEALWGDAKVFDAEGQVTYLSDLKPVSAKQGYGDLLCDKYDDGSSFVYPFCPCSQTVKIVGKVDGKTIELRQSAAEPEAYECTFDGFEAGAHLVWLKIKVGDSPITQHDLVTVQVK